MPSPPASHVLVINAGSSSIRFDLFAQGREAPLWRGSISGIGTSHSSLEVAGEGLACARRFAIPDYVTAATVLRDWVREHVPREGLRAIAHRVVYGGPECWETRVIDGALLDVLYGTASSQPEHLPQELHLMETLRRLYPDAVQLACFDSSFHATLPLHAAMLPIARQYYARGVRRYGFHGLSCAWLMAELARVAGPEAAIGKTVIAHLGGGASVTAVLDGRSCDTTMGLTPAGGIMSGARAGDLDPGLGWYLARTEHMTLAGFQHMVNHDAGLRGVSGSSGDLRTLLEHEAGDSRAAEALTMFCYQVRKAIWAMAGAMDGIDTLIFSGGAGAHAPAVRERVCAGLSALGVTLAPPANAGNAAIVSAPGSAVCVRVMHSNEAAMIARQAMDWLAAAGEGA